MTVKPIDRQFAKLCKWLKENDCTWHSKANGEQRIYRKYRPPLDTSGLHHSNPNDTSTQYLPEKEMKRV